MTTTPELDRALKRYDGAALVELGITMKYDIVEILRCLRRLDVELIRDLKTDPDNLVHADCVIPTMMHALLCNGDAYVLGRAQELVVMKHDMYLLLVFTLDIIEEMDGAMIVEQAIKNVGEIVNVRDERRREAMNEIF